MAHPPGPGNEDTEMADDNTLLRSVRAYVAGYDPSYNLEQEPAADEPIDGDAQGDQNAQNVTRYLPVSIHPSFPYLFPCLCGGDTR